MNLMNCVVYPLESCYTIGEHDVRYRPENGSEYWTPKLEFTPFCQKVSATAHYERIHQRMQEIDAQRATDKKREVKAKRKAKEKPAEFLDGDIRSDGYEYVKRLVFRKPIEGWVPPGGRRNFINQERKRIAQELQRNVESSDSEDTLSSQTE